MTGFSVGSFEGLSVTSIRVGFAVGSFEGEKVGTSVAGIRVGYSVGRFEGVEVGNAVSLSHQMRSRAPCNSIAAISSSVPPVP